MKGQSQTSALKCERSPKMWPFRREQFRPLLRPQQTPPIGFPISEHWE
jgi:hypothetical protein